MEDEEIGDREGEASMQVDAGNDTDRGVEDADDPDPGVKSRGNVRDDDDGDELWAAERLLRSDACSLLLVEKAGILFGVSMVLRLEGGRIFPSGLGRGGDAEDVDEKEPEEVSLGEDVDSGEDCEELLFGADPH